MDDVDGTYTRLAEIAKQKVGPRRTTVDTQPRKRSTDQTPPQPPEDLSTTPYISQNYRFTEDELKWLRRQAYSLSERFGGKVSQNTVLRVALRVLREACRKSPKTNALTEAITQLKK